VLGNVTQSLETPPVENKTDANTNASEPAGTTDSMKISLRIWLRIILWVHRNIVVDHHGDGLDVNPSSKDVRCDENFSLTLAEALDYLVSLCSFEASVKGDNFVAIFC
jgi:hypothetical protein